MVPCFEYAMSEQVAKSARGLGGNAEMMRDIPFSPPDITEKEIEAVTEALRSGWITTGPKTKLFEERIAEYVGTARCLLELGYSCYGADSANIGCRPRR